jgi:hypothetical protein
VQRRAFQQVGMGWTCVWSAGHDDLQVNSVVIVAVLAAACCSLIVVGVAVVVSVTVMIAAEAGQMNVRPRVVVFGSAAVRVRVRHRGQLPGEIAYEGQKCNHATNHYQPV